jgi:phage terminase large subunit
LSEIRFKANARQKEALKLLYDDIHDSVGYGGGGGGGKSYVGVFWCWSQCIMYPGVRYFFGRNELKNIKATTLKTYYKFLSDYSVPSEQQGRFHENTSTITFNNGSEIVLIDLKFMPSDELAKSLGSLELTGGFIDESNEVDFRMIDIVHTRVGRHKNEEYGIFPKILETFNPSKDHVYRRFYKPWRQGTLPKGTAFVQALALDWLDHREYFEEHLQVHPDEALKWYGIYITKLLTRTKTTKQRLLFGNFEYDDDASSLCSYDTISNTFTNYHVKKTGQRYLISDIALQGSDHWVNAVFDGFVLIYIERIAKCTGKEIIERLTQLKIRFSVPNSNIIYDADGVGGFVGDKTGNAGFFPGSKSFVANATPKPVKGDKENYENLKAQCGYRLAKRINDAELYLQAIEHDEEMKELAIEEMEQLKSRDHDKDGKLKLIRKEEQKANIGRSPDLLDVLQMREYGELTPRPKGLSVGNR